MDCNAIAEEEEEEDLTIHTMEKGVVLKNWTVALSRARRVLGYNLKLNPAKCAFRVAAGKVQGFIVSRWGIELDPSKVKAIQGFPPSKSKKDGMSFLGHLNYISRFIAQSTVICEPILKMLKKDAVTK
ncbi:putative mitochondrial protein AtMg00860 [Nicotiana tabacum]|uniref:Mitochondrial protein AtMg00860 n=1 Tax=Nicotiana tabacum TaxID=4097 RepID=A0AC58RXF6_TOBAC